MDQKHTVATLNDLIETLKDGQTGFQHAAESVQESDLKTLFSGYALQRAKFAGDLQQELVHLGEAKPEESSTVAGALHRGWINLKGALSGGGRHAILAECERGEDHALSVYRKTLEDKNLPAPLRETVHNQHQEILAAHNKVRALRDASAKS